MRSTQPFSITPPNKMAEAVRSKVAAGDCATESEVCREGVEIFPLQEVSREDIRPGLRITHHRGRSVIAVAVNHDSRRVSILGVLYGGQDFERAPPEGGDA